MHAERQLVRVQHDEVDARRAAGRPDQRLSRPGGGAAVTSDFPSLGAKPRPIGDAAAEPRATFVRNAGDTRVSQGHADTFAVLRPAAHPVRRAAGRARARRARAGVRGDRRALPRPAAARRRRYLPEARAEDALQQALHRRVERAAARRRGARPARLAVPDRPQHGAEPAAGRRATTTRSSRSRCAAGEAPQEELERRAVVRQTLTGLAALPERQREALLRIAVEGRSQEEVARELGVTEGAVRQLVHRARLTLRAAATAVMPLPLASWAAAPAGARRRRTADGRADRRAGRRAPARARSLAKAGAVAVLATGTAVAGPAIVAVRRRTRRRGPRGAGGRAAGARPHADAGGAPPSGDRRAGRRRPTPAARRGPTRRRRGARRRAHGGDGRSGRRRGADADADVRLERRPPAPGSTRARARPARARHGSGRRAPARPAPARPGRARRAPARRARAPAHPAPARPAPARRRPALGTSGSGRLRLRLGLGSVAPAPVPLRRDARLRLGDPPTPGSGSGSSGLRPGPARRAPARLRRLGSASSSRRRTDAIRARTDDWVAPGSLQAHDPSGRSPEHAQPRPDPQRPRPRGARRAGSRRPRVRAKKPKAAAWPRSTTSPAPGRPRTPTRTASRTSTSSSSAPTRARPTPTRTASRTATRSRPATTRSNADTDGDGIKDGAEHAGVVTAFDGETITIREFKGGKKRHRHVDNDCTPTTRTSADDSSVDDEAASTTVRRRRLGRRRPDRRATTADATTRTSSTSTTPTRDASRCDVEDLEKGRPHQRRAREPRRRDRPRSSPSSPIASADRDHALDRQPGALGDRLRHLHRRATSSRSASRSFGSVIIFM